MRKSGISGAGATASAFFVRVNLSPFVWGRNLRSNGFLLFVGYFIELVIFAEIGRYFRRYLAVRVNLSRFQQHLRPSVGIFKACQRFGRLAPFRPSGRVSRPYLRPCFFFLLYYIILLYRVRALRGRVCIYMRVRV